MKTIAIDPTPLHFDYSQERELLDKLGEIDRSTALIPLATAADVAVDSEGCVGPEKFRLTKWAFMQLCKELCIGLHDVVMDYSGAYRLLNQPREDFSFEEAVDIFNRLVRRRFRSRLQGKAFLRNAANKTIDGLLGTKYKWLSNLHLFEQASAMVEQLKDRFLEAQLIGRWMSVRFVHPDPWFSVDFAGPDKFYAGCYLSNNEVGKASVRGHSMIYRRLSNTSSLLTTGQGVRHTGSEFKDKLKGLIQTAGARQQKGDFYATHVKRLASIPLGFGSTDQTTLDKLGEDLVAKLARRGLPASVGKRVIGNLTFQGSYEPAPQEPEGFMPVERTAFDLYNSLGRDARLLPISQAERAEQVAYSLLVGKITV